MVTDPHWATNPSECEERVDSLVMREATKKAPQEVLGGFRLFGAILKHGRLREPSASAEQSHTHMQRPAPYPISIAYG